MTRRAYILIAICVILILSVTAWLVVRGSVDDRPNVVLITIDALRADHLPFYGHDTDTAPFMASLAERGYLFETCIASSCWTAPSMTSIFTSLYPRSHGVRHGIISNGKVEQQELLPDSFLTLAEVLKQSGYRTFGLSSNPHMSEEFGTAQGFDRFMSNWFCGAEQIHGQAHGWRKEMATSEPFFLWVHYFDPHDPYIPHDTATNVKVPMDRYRRELAGQKMRWIRKNKGKLQSDPKMLKALKNIYDSEIAYTDMYVQRLLTEVLPDDGNTIVIITADHGEQFLDHGRLGHAQTLYQEELHVPLIILMPGQNKPAGRAAIKGPSSILDIYPTILELLEIEEPAHCQGRSLVGRMTGDVKTDGRPVYAEIDRGVSRQAIVKDNWKLIHHPVPGKPKLFDLENDPDERRNAAASQAEKSEELKTELDEWISRTPHVESTVAPARLNDRQKEQLRSLGYLK